MNGILMTISDVFVILWCLTVNEISLLWVINKFVYIFLNSCLQNKLKNNHLRFFSSFHKAGNLINSQHADTNSKAYFVQPTGFHSSIKDFYYTNKNQIFSLNKLVECHTKYNIKKKKLHFLEQAIFRIFRDL